MVNLWGHGPSFQGASCRTGDFQPILEKRGVHTGLSRHRLQGGPGGPSESCFCREALGGLTLLPCRNHVPFQTVPKPQVGFRARDKVAS